MKPTLLVLAAGMGSRYGGLKQMEPVGPSGETLLDFAVMDAAAAGFGRVVFVIRRDFEAAFRTAVAARAGAHLAVGYAFQAMDDLPAGHRPPAGRERPWGTGHAVWCARDAVDGPFAVINADDFYGRDAFTRLAAFLATAAGGRYALAGFRLDRTLSDHGAVARGVCRVEDGRLVSIEEVTGLTPADVGPGRRFSGAETVSMNCWGFTPDVFAELGAGLGSFLAERGGDLRAEFQLPVAVSAVIAAGRATADVLASEGDWFGVTFREDRPRVAAALAALVARGDYPAAGRAP